MMNNLRFLYACIALSCVFFAAVLAGACTPQQRAAVASAAPCLEACAPLLLEEVASVEAPASISTSSLAFSLEAPARRPRIVVHRRCSGWVPVLLPDAGADASSVKADDAIQPPREPTHGRTPATFDAGREAGP